MELKGRINISDSTRAGMLRRGFAAIGDIYLSSVLANIPILFIYSIETGQKTMTGDIATLSKSAGLLAGVLGILMVLLYYVVIPTYKWSGQTLMKRLLGIKIVKNNGEDVDLKTMLKREVLGSTLIEGGFISSGNYIRQIILILTGSTALFTGMLYLSFAITILSIVLIMFSNKKRAIHDYIAQTQVLMGGE